MSYLCKCNNCDTVMWDDNTDTDTAINVEGFDFSMLKNSFPEQIYDNENYQFCPHCIRDDFFSDIYSHNLAKSIYDAGLCKTKWGFPVRKMEADIDLSNYPNFSATGSIKGIKNKYYGLHVLLVKKGGFIYNVTSNPALYFIHSS